MGIRNHKLAGVKFDRARHIGGEITPRIIVLHDTASRLDKFSAANYLKNNSAKVSVHFVVETDGTITQQVPTNRRANHAGKSEYHNIEGCNDFAIGIEIVNPGRMTLVSSTHAKAWFGALYSASDHHIEELATPEHGHGVWMGYTAEQIAAVLKICHACFDKYSTLQDITTHWYISPGRKVDTNPLFPLQHVRSLIMGRDDPVDVRFDSEASPRHLDEVATIQVPNSTLNMRRWPSFNPNVIATIPDGAIVPHLATGEFGGRKWHKVIFDGREGWIVAKYATLSNGGAE